MLSVMHAERTYSISRRELILSTIWVWGNIHSFIGRIQQGTCSLSVGCIPHRLSLNLYWIYIQVGPLYLLSIGFRLGDLNKLWSQS